jgi:hypothetical protein
MNTTMRQRRHHEKSPPRPNARFTWAAYAGLFALSIPWYFPNGGGEPLVWGFPLWGLISLLCYVGVAALTIWKIGAVWQSQVGSGTDQRIE